MCNCEECLAEQYAWNNRHKIEKKIRSRKCQNECANLHCKNQRVESLAACSKHVCLNPKCDQKKESYRTGKYAFCGRCTRPKCPYPDCQKKCVNHCDKDHTHCGEHQYVDLSTKEDEVQETTDVSPKNE
jgi:hypothetical protein